MSGENARLVGDQRCGFSKWELDLGSLGDYFGGYMEGLINNALAAEGGVTVTFPFIYSPDGAAMSPTAFGIENDPAGPLTIRVCLPFGDAEEEDVHLDADIREALTADIDQCREDGSYREGIAAIAAAMRKLADDLDQAVADGEKAEAERAAKYATGEPSIMCERDFITILRLLHAAPQATRVYLLQNFIREHGPLDDRMREAVGPLLNGPAP